MFCYLVKASYRLDTVIIDRLRFFSLQECQVPQRRGHQPRGAARCGGRAEGAGRVGGIDGKVTVEEKKTNGEVLVGHVQVRGR